MAEKVLLYDTTLRDGMQGEGMSLSVDEKVRVAHALDELGMHLIEAGFPELEPEGGGAVRPARARALRDGEIVAFGMTAAQDAAAADDPALRLLADCFAPVCTPGRQDLAAAPREGHAGRPRGEPADDRRLGRRSCVGEGKRVIYDAEHFFDAFRDDAGLRAALPARRGRGGRRERDAVRHQRLLAARRRSAEATARVVAELGDDVQVGIHTHDDAGCGVANALVAVEQGARMVQGTMNGYGERCGNANLVTILPGAAAEAGLRLLAPERLGRLTETAHLVDELCNVTPNPNQPYVGANAFAHKGGMHVAGVEPRRAHVRARRPGRGRRRPARAGLRAVGQGHGAGAGRATGRTRRRHRRGAWSSASRSSSTAATSSRPPTARSTC